MTRRQSEPDATGELWVERVVLVNGVPWVSDGGVSGDGGIMGETIGIGVVSIWVVGGIKESVVSGIVVGIVPNKITHLVDVPTLSSDESDETEITEIAMNCTSKSLYKYPLYQPCMMWKRMIKWVNERINEWVNECIDE
ncbi:hypothetical protein Tco_1011889 [Tanacetum coccineum]